VHVFYEDLRYTEIDENPAMDIVALLGSLGGNLGLFLGASVLSFTELFIFLYDLTKQGLKVLWANHQMKKKKRNMIMASTVHDTNYSLM
jgi:acid-sensing ion channel 5